MAIPDGTMTVDQEMRAVKASSQSFEVDEQRPFKKRKRPTENGDLEIDLDLPEPLSKKALRKSKKRGTVVQPADSETSQKEEYEIKLAVPHDPTENSKRSQWGIWIGNLPWTATKQEVRAFIISNAGLAEEAITRIHMPAPLQDNKRNKHGAHRGTDYHNKGFAYIDFDTRESLKNAIALNETQFPGNSRKVLIKDAKSFEGRPAQSSNSTPGKGLSSEKANAQKPPSKRVFVGNLAFQTTKDDLREHYAQCGAVADVFMATFEDSGKSKGYAWVTFEELQAAEAAVRGRVVKDDGTASVEVEDTEHASVSGKDKRSSSAKAQRKVLVNRLHGRELRVEYAEAADVRYRKRFGKGLTEGSQEVDGIGESFDDPSRSKDDNTANDKRRVSDRRQNPEKTEPLKAIHRQPPQNLETTTNAGASVVSKGTKITFDD